MTSRLFSKLLLAVALGTAAVTFAPSQSAHAAVFAEMSLDQFTDASAVIVQGTVREVWTELDDAGNVWTRARVKVVRTLKGVNVEDEVIVDSLGGVHEGRAYIVHGQAKFAVGEEAIFFLSPGGRGQARLVPVAKFLGVRIVRRAPGERRRYTTTWQGKSGETEFDYRFIPHPPADARVYVDDLIESIEARLDVGWDGTPVPGLSEEKLIELNTPARRLRQ